MSWFTMRRQEFIAAHFRQFGQIRRSDLVREFQITLQVASSDIQAFIETEPKLVTYDVSAKCYVLVEEPDS